MTFSSGTKEEKEEEKSDFDDESLEKLKWKIDGYFCRFIGGLHLTAARQLQKIEKFKNSNNNNFKKIK